MSSISYYGKGDATHRIFHAVILLMMLRSDNILVNSHGNSDHNILDTTFQTKTYNTPAGYFIAQIVVKNYKNKTVEMHKQNV